MTSTEIKPAPILEIQDLSITVRTGTKILDSFSWTFERGKIYSLIGESGSGKTSFAFSLFGILPRLSKIDYSKFDIGGTDWKVWEQRDWLNLRGKKIAMIPQNPNLAFHPYRTLGDQLIEFFAITNNDYAKPDRIIEILENFGLRSPEQAFDSLPSRLSGGEKQRICIAMVHFSGAEIIVADEPTTALDPIQTKKIMQLLLRPVKEENRTLILITHNLKLMNKIADEVMVIKNGKMVEKNIRSYGEIFSFKSEYAQMLMENI
ncbi:ATP-binding cassette domain-containing protein [Leptospira sp. GIMC2001]|uniref:ATP-binding cassette domain-containing protein n=1 Tax=Leptospira sp. GIMC2001 TaxID=1513297 RepID=UPI002348FD96|nr:ATP-binding cassette domain-containing protein [Leptospira sp. GIMC2001]WCL47882.1 ATP-binding cassette domain-containing protein [Leptospira sp. GIMC2001]